MEDEDIRMQLRALGDPTRYKIVQYLRERNHCPRSLALTLGISESAISQHMTVLRKAGLVSGYRHSYHIHYQLVEEKFQQVIDVMQSWVDGLDQTKGCHGPDSCQFRLDNGSDGCLYQMPTEDGVAGAERDVTDQSTD